MTVHAFLLLQKMDALAVDSEKNLKNNPAHKRRDVLMVLSICMQNTARTSFSFSSFLRFSVAKTYV